MIFVWGPTFFLASVAYDIKGHDTAALVCRAVALIAFIFGWRI